ncbi:MAG: ATPase [Rhizobium sp.]|nr:ATPase [Rhizobium sp.]
MSIPAPSAKADAAVVIDFVAKQDEAPTLDTRNPPLDLITPIDWARHSPIDPGFLVQNRIVNADVSMLTGDGGSGKTTISLQLAAAVALNRSDWLGGIVNDGGPVIFYSGEEPDHIIYSRLSAIGRAQGFELDELGNLHLCFPTPDECLLGAVGKTGLMEPTQKMHSFRRSVEEIKPRLVIVDSAAATYGGGQNTREQVRSFVGLFRSIARSTGAAILLLDHPSMAGLNSGEGRGGNVDWQNACRARLYFRHLKNDDADTNLRELSVQKTNYGPGGEKLNVRWQAGLFVPDGSASPIAQAELDERIERKFMRLLDLFRAQGRDVSPKPSRSGAAVLFAKHPEADGIKHAACDRAQERLLGRAAIQIETFGPPSKQSQRLVRAG